MKIFHCLLTITIIIVFLLISFVSSRPTTAARIPPQEAIKFMRKYGYLEETGPDAETLYREETIKDAIKTLQKFGHLPQTGIIDDATLQLMETPRCGVPDVIRKKSNRTKRYIIGSEGWNKRSITYFLANWSPKLKNREQVLNQLHKAFEIWSGYSHLHFTHVESVDADIIIFFARGPHGDGYPMDGPGMVLAHAFFPYEGDEWGGDIHFDDDEDWTLGTEDGVEFFMVATHEIGHSLGLSHSPVPDSIMFPYYKGYDPYLRLGYDDILAMYQLYVTRPIDDGYPFINTVPHGDDDRDKERDDDSRRQDDDGINNDSYERNKENDDRKESEEKSDKNYDYDEENFNRDDNYNDIPDDENRDGNKNEIDDPYGSLPNPEPTPDIRWEDEYGQADKDGQEDSVFHYDDPFTEYDHTEKSRDIETTTTTSTTTTTTTTTVSPIPDLCEGSYDSIAMLRNELFVFKDEWVWRFRERGQLEPNYPVRFRHMFHFPKNVTRIDAVYERSYDNAIVFFSGQGIWFFDGSHFINNEPRPFSEFELPNGIQRIDAAFVWGKNGKTYFFSRNLYWRYNSVTQRMDPNYPHDISRWRGIPSSIDTAFRWRDGQTYFFKDKIFYRFNDQQVIVDQHYPLPAPQFWFGCPEEL